MFNVSEVTFDDQDSGASRPPMKVSDVTFDEPAQQPIKVSDVQFDTDAPAQAQPRSATADFQRQVFGKKPQTQPQQPQQQPIDLPTVTYTKPNAATLNSLRSLQTVQSPEAIGLPRQASDANLPGPRISKLTDQQRNEAIANQTSDIVKQYPARNPYAVSAETGVREGVADSKSVFNRLLSLLQAPDETQSFEAGREDQQAKQQEYADRREGYRRELATYLGRPNVQLALRDPDFAQALARAVPRAAITLGRLGIESTALGPVAGAELFADTALQQEHPLSADSLKQQALNAAALGAGKVTGTVLSKTALPGYAQRAATGIATGGAMYGTARLGGADSQSALADSIVLGVLGAALHPGKTATPDETTKSASESPELQQAVFQHVQDGQSADAIRQAAHKAGIDPADIPQIIDKANQARERFNDPTRPESSANAPGRTEDIPPQAPAEELPQSASVKAFITKSDEVALRSLGYSDDDIYRMKPDEAQRIMAAAQEGMQPEPVRQEATKQPWQRTRGEYHHQLEFGDEPVSVELAGSVSDPMTLREEARGGHLKDGLYEGGDDNVYKVTDNKIEIQRDLKSQYDYKEGKFVITRRSAPDADIRNRPIFHGTDQNDLSPENLDLGRTGQNFQAVGGNEFGGVYFTTKPSTANIYGKNTVEAQLKPEANVIDYKNVKGRTTEELLADGVDAVTKYPIGHDYEEVTVLNPKVLKEGGHKAEVRRALVEGKPVPPEVLADYPDLQRQSRVGQPVTHPDEAIHGKPIIAQTQDGRVVVENPDNQSGVSIVKDRSESGQAAAEPANISNGPAETRSDINESATNSTIAPDFDKEAKLTTDALSSDNTELAKAVDRVAGGDTSEPAIQSIKDAARQHGISDSTADAIIDGATRVSRGKPTESIESRAGETPSAKTDVEESPRDVVGVKNAVTDAEREALNQPKVDTSEQKRGFEKVIETGKKAVDDGRVDPAKLADQIANKPRPLTPEETASLLYHKTQLLNQEDSIMRELREHRESGDLEKEIDTRGRLQSVQESLDTARIASRKSGYEQGLGLAIRRAMLERDYSLARLKDRAEAANKGKPLSPAEVADLEKLRDSIMKREEAYQEYDERKSKGAASKTVTELRKEAAGERRSKRTQTKTDLDGEFKSQKAALAKLFGRGGNKPLGGGYSSERGAIDPEILTFPVEAIKLLRDMAKNRLQAGIATVDGVVDSIHEALKDTIEGVTPRQIRDAISGYGQTSKMNPEKLAVAMRELRRQMQMASKIEDVLGGKRPLRSGLQRDAVTPETRQAIRDLNKLMREHGIEQERAPVDPGQQQRSALDAVKTRLRNEIDDLDKHIAGESIPGKEHLKLQYDDEAIALQSERDVLKRQLEDPATKNKQAVQERLNEAQRRLRENDLSRKEAEYPSTIYDDAETTAMRGKLKELNQQIAEKRELPDRIKNLQDKIDDVKSRIDNNDYSKKTPAEKATRPVPAEVADLRSRLKDLNRQLSAARQEAKATDTLRNRIAELQRRIREKDFSSAAKEAPKQPSPEVAKLRSQRDDFLKDYQRLKPSTPLTDSQRLDIAKKATQRSIDEYQRRMDEKDFATKQKGAAATDPELDSLKARRDALKEDYQKLADADPEAIKRREAQKLAQLKDRMQKRIDDLQRQFNTGKFYQNAGGKLVTSKPRVPFAGLDPEAEALKASVAKAQEAADAKIKAIELANRSSFEKSLDFIAKLRRFIVLSSAPAVEKLSAAGALRNISDPIEAGVGGAIARIPGISDIAARAPREGAFKPSVEAQATSLYIKKMMDLSRFKETLKTGKGRLDYLHGEKQYFDSDSKADRILGFYNRLHAALKEPVKEAEYFRSTQYRTDQAARSGLDITDPKVRDSIAAQAYLDAQRKVFMNPNFVTDAYQNAISSLGRHDGIAPKALATLMKILFPVVRVPTNYIGETLGYGPGGFAKAGVRIWQEGIKNLSPDDADYVMRNLKKGLVGTAAMALGAGLSNQFGGFFTQGKGNYSTPDKMKPGEVKILGVNVPRLFLHHPMIEAMQAGATFMHLHGKGKSAISAFGGTALALGEEQPFIGQTIRNVHTITEPGKFDPGAGEFVGGLVIPPDARRLAGILDPKTPTGPTTKAAQLLGLQSADPQYRRAKTFWDGIQKQIPGRHDKVGQ